MCSFYHKVLCKVEVLNVSPSSEHTGWYDMFFIARSYVSSVNPSSEQKRKLCTKLYGEKRAISAVF